jgi:hypothetical protein
MSNVLALVAATLTITWGTAHLFPTRSVVRGFGDIGVENERVITMEWILEGVTLIFVGVLAARYWGRGYGYPRTATVRRSLWSGSEPGHSH